MSKKKNDVLLINSKIWIYLHPSLIYSLQLTIAVSRPQVLQSPKFLTPHLSMTTIICPCWHWERPLGKASRCRNCQIVASQHAENRIFLMGRFIQPSKYKLVRHKHKHIINEALTPHHAIKSEHLLRETSGSLKKQLSSASGSSCHIAWGVGRCWPAFCTVANKSVPMFSIF